MRAEKARTTGEDMAVKGGKRKKGAKGARTARWIGAALLALMAAFLLYCAIAANTVAVRRAEVFLADLPPAFDGATALYVSDIDLCGINTPAKSAALFRRLQSLSPDLLLLGGDYTSPSLFEVLNSGAEEAGTVERQLHARADFFQRISGFDAPLGKYAIAAPSDPDASALAQTLSDAGIRPLFNNAVAVERGGERLELVGTCSEEAMQNIASISYSREACVIALAYSPALVPRLMTMEASDSGHWADLILTGHTHGGQVNVFGRSVLTLTPQERTLLSGWSMEAGVPVLTTSGLGCEGANLRLGSQAEVWRITLRRPVPEAPGE